MSNHSDIRRPTPGVYHFDVIAKGRFEVSSLGRGSSNATAALLLSCRGFTFAGGTGYI